VANKDIPAPPSDFISAIRVADGADVADRYIFESATPDDVVITADIPLAAHLVEKGVAAINPRGEIYDENNIGQRLATRNFMEGMRGAGAIRGGPAAFKATDKQKFANALDRILTKKLREGEDRKA